MKRLKLTKATHANYTGPIGRYAFVDGVSVELIPEVERIRIAANFGCVEIDEDGNEGKNPSPAVSVAASRRLKLIREPLPRQSDEEKVEENLRAVMGSETLNLILSREAVEEIASEKGIAGLREIATPWNVRSKSIPVLMQMILDAQGEYVAVQRVKLAERGIASDEIERLLTPVEKLVKAEEVKVNEVVTTAEPSAVIETPLVPDTIGAAAASGDLAAAIAVVEANRPE